VKIHGLPRSGFDGINRNNTVLARSDERLRVGEGERRDLADVKILKKTSRLLRLAPFHARADEEGHLSVVAKEEAHAVIRITPFQKLVVLRRQVEAERGSAEKSV